MPAPPENHEREREVHEREERIKDRLHRLETEARLYGIQLPESHP